MAAIEVRNLLKHWNQTKAVDGISFRVNKGEIFGFLGPNGAGKTTTIKMLVGLTKPTSGNAVVVGHDVINEIRQVKQSIGVVPERSNLYDELTVYENLRFVSKLYHVRSHEIENKIVELLELFQLNEYRDRRFAKLSKGLKRRTVLAAALVHEPLILFLDEPTSGLDIMSARKLRETISNLSSQGVTIFLTTHYIEEAGQLCDRIALLVKGKIQTIGTPEELRNSLQDTPILKVHVTGQMEDVSADEIEGENVTIDNDEIILLTRDIHSSLSSLLEIAQAHDLHIESIETTTPRLEDAFIQLTGVSLDSMGVEKEGKR